MIRSDVQHFVIETANFGSEFIIACMRFVAEDSGLNVSDWLTTISSEIQMGIVFESAKELLLALAGDQ